MTRSPGPAGRRDGSTQLADQTFVSLVTYRRSGEGVATPVWVVGDGGSLLVSTPAGSGKVRRLQRDPSVSLVPCGRSGAVDPGHAPVHGTAAVHADEAMLVRAGDLLLAKYGWEYRSIMAMEQLGRRDPGRVVLRLSIRPHADGDGGRGSEDLTGRGPASPTAGAAQGRPPS